MTYKKRNPKPAAKIKRLPPSAAAARDEGPRLLPLADSTKEPSRLEHYLELADSALGNPVDKADEPKA